MRKIEVRALLRVPFMRAKTGRSVLLLFPLLVGSLVFAGAPGSACPSSGESDESDESDEEEEDERGVASSSATGPEHGARILIKRGRSSGPPRA